MARDAFAEDVPSSIVNRRYKGLAAAPDQDFVSENLESIRHALDGGYLVSEGIVDRHVLDEIFARHATPDPRICADLHNCMTVEVWAKNALSFSARRSHLASLSG
jgi:hypothetical protein